MVKMKLQVLVLFLVVRFSNQTGTALESTNEEQTTTTEGTNIESTTIETTTIEDCTGGVIVSGQCLWFSTEKLSWHDAKKKCESQNKRLVVPKDPQALIDYVATNLSMTGAFTFWIGASDLANEGSWVWLDGRPLGDNYPWNNGEPNNLGDEDCLTMGNDLWCTHLLQYVCEKGCSPQCFNGYCTLPSTCTCYTGWEGAQCLNAICTLQCVNGNCTAPNNCTCNKGWEGPQCQNPSCAPKCVNGNCTAPYTCTCNEGWEGAQCQNPVCARQNQCVNGFCTAPNTCTCINPGWEGALCQYAKYGCFYNQTSLTYNPGQVIESNAENCTMVRCSGSGGVIEHVYEPPNNPGTGCCLCHGKLYGQNSQTCKAVRDNEKCPAPCYVDGREYAHGGFIGFDLPQCVRKWCISGKIKLRRKYEATGCCLNEENEMQAPGSVVDSGGCLAKVCRNGLWSPSHNTIMSKCKKCCICNDPHFSGFSGVTFDWHDGCNYALVQDVTNPPNIEFGVFMDFDRRGTIGYIGGPTTYLEDGQKVVLDPGNLNQVIVGGNTIEINNRIPVLLPGTTTYVWRSSYCIRLYGKNNILVELCKNCICIWAPAPWTFGQTPLRGLCGSTFQKELEAKKLVDKNFKQYTVSGWYPDAPEEFGNSWKAADQTKENCRTSIRSKKPSLRQTQSQNIRKGCASANNTNNEAKCTKVADDAGLTGEARDNLYYACLFDLCIVVEDPEAPFTEDETLQQHNENAVQTKSHIESTIEFVPSEPRCPTGWSPIGDKCYQVYTFNASLSLEDVENHCISDKGALAYPSDAIAFNIILQAADTEGSYWLGGRNEDGTTEWLIGGGKIPKDQFMIGKPRWSINTPNNCLELEENNDTIKQDVLGNRKLPKLPSSSDVDLSESRGRPKYLNIHIKLRIHNRKENQTTTIEKECIVPQFYICEREPLACGDESPECDWREEDGQCTTNRAYMLNNCKESCNVPCECDQPETCTDIGGMCQPLDATCAATSDPDFCTGENCTCCYSTTHESTAGKQTTTT